MSVAGRKREFHQRRGKGAQNMKTLRSIMTALVFGSTAMANNLWYPVSVYQTDLDVPSGGRLVVFVSDDNGTLYDDYTSGGQWIWQNQGLPPGARANCQNAVYDPVSHRIHVFVEGDNTQLYEKFWNDYTHQWEWVPWGHPSGPSGSPGVYCPSAVYQPTLGYDPIAVFAAGTDAHFYELASCPGCLGKQWSDIGAPAGGLLSAPSAVYQPTQDQIVVFGAGWGSGHLHVWNSQQWQWEDAGLPEGANYVVNPSTVYQTSLDRIVAFVTSVGNGHLYDLYGDGHQWVWDTDQGTPPGVTSVANPSAVYQTSRDRLVVFVTGSDGHLYDKYWDGHQWVWDTDQGTPPGVTSVANPSAVYQTLLDRLVVFVIGSDGHLYDKYWDSTAGQWVWDDRGQP
jgi:hypothetical protein